MFNVNKTTQLIKGALFEPQATWQAYLSEENDWKETARILTLPLIVGALFLTLVCSLVFGNSILFSTGIGLGAMLVGVLIGFAGFMITAFILASLAGVFRGNNNFDKAFAAVSLTAVPSYVGVVLGTLPWIGGLLSLGFLIYALVLLYRIIPDYLAVPPGSRVWHFISSMIAVFVISLLLASVFGVGIIGTFAEDALS